MAVWDKFLTPQDRQVYELSGYGTRGGFGRRPAVAIIDVVYAFTGDRDLPIEESVKTWHNSCGHAGWAAIPPTQKLLAAARRNRIPVFYTGPKDWRPDGFDAGAWTDKCARTFDDPALAPALPVRGNDIVREIAPAPHEIVIEK